MARTGPTALVLAILAAAAAAFAWTEHLKLQPTPIAGTRVTKVFSPVCACPTRIAEIAFRLRGRSHLTVDVVDAADHRVVRLVDGERRGPGLVTLAWDGRDAAGALVPDGTYRPRVDLGRPRRSITLPSPMRVDTSRPAVTIVSAAPARISPDGDGRREYVRVRYRLSEHAKAILLVNGRRAVGPTRFAPLRGKLDWSGRLRRVGVPPGRYTLSLQAADAAGNTSEPVPVVRAVVRYTELARSRVRTRAGHRFGVRVVTDAKAFRWRFAGRTGVGRPGVLVLRAPKKPGRYRLVVQANRHRDLAVVVVRKRK